MTMPPTIFIVDDDEAIHLVLEARLKRLLHIAVNIICYWSAYDFLEHYRPDQYGCLLLDNRLPGMTGVDLHEYLRAQNCSLPIIMMTSYGDISLAVMEMKKGLFHFIEKPFDYDKLAKIIQQAIEYHAHLLQLHQIEVQPQELSDRLTQLTNKEWLVLEGVIAGKLSDTIARELQISYKTVERHRVNVMRKLQVRNMVELVRLVSEGRMIQSSSNRD